MLRRLQVEMRSALDVIGYRLFDRIGIRDVLRGRAPMRIGVRAGYDCWAPQYDHEDNAVTLAELDQLRGFLSSLDYTSVLDAACGTGRHTLRFAADRKEVTAFDINEGMLAELRRKVESTGLRVAVTRADLEADLPFPDTSFDLVLCSLALEHVADLSVPLQEFHRVLKPGGHLLYSTFHPDLLRRGGGVEFTMNGERLVVDTWFRPRDEYVAATARAGFTEIRSEEPARKMPGLIGSLFPPVPICFVVRARRR